jgi:hypothetical protein
MEISNVFHQVYHEDLTLKLFILNIPDNVTYLLTSCLKNHTFYIYKNSANSSTHHISSVPHNLVPEQTLYLI